METLILCSALLLTFGSHISHAVFTQQDDPQSQRSESTDVHEALSHIDTDEPWQTDESKPRLQKRSMSWIQQVANYAALTAVGSVSQKNRQQPIHNNTEEESDRMPEALKPTSMKKPTKGHNTKPIHSSVTGKHKKKPSGHKKPHVKPSGDKHKHRRKPAASPTKIITVVVPQSSQDEWYEPQHLSLMHNTGVSFDTSEIQYTKTGHGAAFNDATSQIQQVASTWHGPQHIPMMSDGVPMDTPEVQHAKAAHLSALAAASGSRTRYYMPQWYRQMY